MILILSVLHNLKELMDGIVDDSGKRLKSITIYRMK